MGKRRIATLCDDGWLCQGCPEISVDDRAGSNQQMIITDDFGNAVLMSKDEFEILVSKAKMGEFDRI